MLVFLIYVDNKLIYFTGDTNQTEAMLDFPSLNIDYCLLPIDGVFNMGPKEAIKCAKVIKAKKYIPIHTRLGVLFDEEIAKEFKYSDRLIMHPNDEIEL
ncbi:MAG: MBL fold metallo-hydrolase [Bacilli bacterium]